MISRNHNDQQGLSHHTCRNRMIQSIHLLKERAHPKESPQAKTKEKVRPKDHRTLILIMFEMTPGRNGITIRTNKIPADPTHGHGIAPINSILLPHLLPPPITILVTTGNHLAHMAVPPTGHGGNPRLTLLEIPINSGLRRQARNLLEIPTVQEIPTRMASPQFALIITLDFPNCFSH